jgi:hypothetical protein
MTAICPLVVANTSLSPSVLATCTEWCARIDDAPCSVPNNGGGGGNNGGGGGGGGSAGGGGGNDPEPLNLEGGDLPLDSKSTPVLIRGSGTITPKTGTVLSLADITLETDAKIVAKSLTVTSRLVLRGSASLSAFPGDSITIVNGATKIELIAKGNDVPKLELGNLPQPFTAVASTVTVDFSGLVTALKGFRTTVITAQGFTNCNDWVSKVNFGAEQNFKAECVTQGGNGKLLSETTTLDLVAVPEESNNVLPIILGVVGGGILITVIVAVIVVVIRKKRNQAKVENA